MWLCSEDIAGYTDSEADNNPDAILDDGSCEYSDNPYFNVSISPTGQFNLLIFADTITGLDIGDEIGVFDLEGVVESYARARVLFSDLR